MIYGIILFFLFFVFSFDKNNIFVKNKPLISTNSNFDNTLKNETKRKLDENYDNISIIVESKCLFSYLGTLEDIDKTNIDIIKKSIDRAKKTLEKLIKVQKLGHIDFKNLGFPNVLDSGFKNCIDENLINNGTDADLVIFMRGSQTEGTLKSYVRTNIIKYGTNTNRPIIGTFIYNFLDFPKDENYSFQLISTLIIHHFTHILGLKKDKLISEGIINNNQVILRINGSKISKPAVVSSHVIDTAKKYFNCSNITYLEINDESNDICEETFHWNARLLLGEYMLANIYYPEQIISEFTLSLLEDLTYYQVNYYTGGLMRYGKNKGCSFIYGDCINIFTIFGQNFINSLFLNEFCNYNSEAIGTCSSGRQSRGYCFSTTRPSEMQEYKRKKSASGFGPKFIEHCPISYEIELYPTQDVERDEKFNGNCKIGNKNFGGYLKYLNEDDNNYRYSDFPGIIEENYSEISFCALSSILKKDEREKSSNSIIKGLIRPTCYQMFCSNTSLTIKINKEYIVCPREGGLIRIESNYTDYEGYLYCPDYNLICTGTAVCNNMFDCVEKSSKIKDNTYIYNYSNILLYFQIQKRKKKFKKFQLKDMS